MAGGPTYYNQQMSMFIKYGIEIPFQRFGYISFGGVYMPEKTIKLDSAVSYQDTVKFGGTSFDITLGIRL